MTHEDSHTAALLSRVAELEEQLRIERKINQQLAERLEGLAVDINHHATRLGSMSAHVATVGARYAGARDEVAR